MNKHGFIPGIQLLANPYVWIVLILFGAIYFAGGGLLALIQNPAEEWTVFPFENSSRGNVYYLPTASGETDIYMVGFPAEITNAKVTAGWSPYGDGSGPINTMTNAIGIEIFVDGHQIGGSGKCYGETTSASTGIKSRQISCCEVPGMGSRCPGLCQQWVVVSSYASTADVTPYFQAHIANKTDHFTIDTKLVYCKGGITQGSVSSGVERSTSKLRIDYLPSKLKERTEILERDCRQLGCPQDYECNQKTGVCERVVVKEIIREVYPEITTDCTSTGCLKGETCKAIACTEDLKSAGMQCEGIMHLCVSEVTVSYESETSVASVSGFFQKIIDAIWRFIRW